jgi:uncharacterized protein (UPF0276 family)
MSINANSALKAGVGFKPAHFPMLIGAHGGVDFIEIHAENYMGAGGAPHAQLSALRHERQLSIHGVALSLGGTDPLDETHLQRLRTLCLRYEPALVSEHLAWSSHDGVWYADLLPFAYTTESLRRVVHHVERMQEVLRRRVLIENPSTYVSLSGSALEETEFLAELVSRSGCGLLLDLNNAVVSCRNRSTSPQAYVDAFPLHAVGQIHVAGHAVTAGADGSELRVDDHGSAVTDEVWTLLRSFVATRPAVPTLLEWDTNIPTWPVIAAELVRIGDALASCQDSRQAAGGWS